MLLIAILFGMNVSLKKVSDWYLCGFDTDLYLKCFIQQVHLHRNIAIHLFTGCYYDIDIEKNISTHLAIVKNIFLQVNVG